MADILLPPSLRIARLSWLVDDRTAADESPITGSVQTSAIYGTRKRRIRLEFRGLNTKDRSLQAYKAFVAQMQGRKNRVWLGDPSYSVDGQMPSSELLTNNDFSSGTSSWSTDSGGGSASVSDSVYRVLRTAMAGLYYPLLQSATPVQYAPHAIRIFRSSGRGSFSGQSLLDATDGFVSSAISDGLSTYAYVPKSSGARNVGIVDTVTSGQTAGDFFSVSWSSYSRCALTDNGPNALTYSDQFDNAAWSKNGCSASANSTAAPDGTTTADTITSSSGSNAVTQGYTVSASAADQACSFCVKAGSQSWVSVGMTDNVLGPVTVFVNLSNGAQGTITTGSGWSNARAFVTALGNGWYRVDLVARKTGSSTTVNPFAQVASADSTPASSGTIYLWRGGAYPSGVPFRSAQTTSSATTGTSQTGASIYLKGLPASTSGLLKAGAQIQISSYVRHLTSSLDSDAAGLGLLQLDEPIPNGTTDGEFVIFCSPMGRFMLSSDLGYSVEPGIFGDAELELVEA